MESNPSGNDPKTIWQKQPAETTKMTLILIRKTARDLRAKTRRELLGIAWAQIAFAIFAIVGIVRGAGWAQRAGFAIALIWCIAGAWIYQKGMWPAPMPGDAGLATGLEYYRREIDRRRSLIGNWLIWVLCPVIFTLGVFMAPLIAWMLATDPKMLRNTIPFFIVLAVWAIAMAVLRIRKRRELEREIEELNEIGKESQAS